LPRDGRIIGNSGPIIPDHSKNKRDIFLQFSVALILEPAILSTDAIVPPCPINPALLIAAIISLKRLVCGELAKSIRRCYPLMPLVNPMPKPALPWLMSFAFVVPGCSRKRADPPDPA